MEENTSTRNTPSKLRKLFVSDVFDPESGMLLGGMNLFASACLFIMSLPLLIVSIERLNANFEPLFVYIPIAFLTGSIFYGLLSVLFILGTRMHNNSVLFAWLKFNSYGIPIGIIYLVFCITVAPILIFLPIYFLFGIVLVLDIYTCTGVYMFCLQTECVLNEWVLADNSGNGRVAMLRSNTV